MKARDSRFCENLEDLKSQSLGIHISSLSSNRNFSGRVEGRIHWKAIKNTKAGACKVHNESPE